MSMGNALGSLMSAGNTASALGQAGQTQAQMDALTQAGIQVANDAAMNQFKMQLAQAWQEILKSVGSMIKNAAAPAA
jgi:NAD-dependent oxidoreductase involved in siderophore biosynthesis